MFWKMWNFNKLPRLGMRTLKTGFAVFIVLSLSQWGWITTPFYAAIGTILAMQPTLKASMSEGKIRIFGSLLGGMIGYFATLLGITNPFWIGLIVILTIYGCHAFGLNEAISITLTLILSILVDPHLSEPLSYCLLRTWDTLVGVIVGLAVNLSIARPR